MIYEVNEEAYLPTSDVIICSDCGEPNDIRRKLELPDSLKAPSTMQRAKTKEGKGG